MIHLPDGTKLLSLAECAEHLGIKATSLRVMRSRGDFIDPVGFLGSNVPAFSLADVDGYAAARGRKAPRPTKDSPRRPDVPDAPVGPGLELADAAPESAPPPTPAESEPAPQVGALLDEGCRLISKHLAPVSGMALRRRAVAASTSDDVLEVAAVLRLFVDQLPASRSKPIVEWLDHALSS